jgi:ribosome maturation protein SDO1
MTSLDKAIIASYDREGKHFEIYVDPDAAYAYLEKKKPDLKNILVAEEVYENAKKAERAKSTDLEKAFGTTDMIKILEIVLNKGEVQLTTEQRKKKVEERRKQIVAILLRESIDPRTKAPHTLQRIETALEEAKIHVDPFKDPREQLTEIVKKLVYVLPLKFDKIKIAVKIPPAFAHRCYGTVKSYGIQQEQWGKNGSLMVMVEIFAGMQGEFYDKLNKMTSGQVETKVIER